MLPFARSPSVELEGKGSLAAATALLAPMGLVPVPTADGHARVSLAAIHYRFFGGLLKGSELWLSVVAQPRDGGPPGHAYLATTADKWFLQKIGERFGIPYTRAAISVSAADSAQVVVGDPEQPALVMRQGARSLRPVTKVHTAADFPGFSPTGNEMRVALAGEATRRSFDPAADALELDADTPLGGLTRALDFKPFWWTTHTAAAGGIRALRANEKATALPQASKKSLANPNG